MGRLGGLVLALTLTGGSGLAWAQGDALYRRYCASCHGVTGIGDGPAAASLDPRPANLRALDVDVPELMRVIDGRRTIRAHGSAAMPVWGEVLEAEKAGEPHAGRTTLHQVRVLAEFVRSLRDPR